MYQQAGGSPRWQLCLLQGQGEALTCSQGWAGLGFASEVRGSGVVPHEVWRPSFLQKLCLIVHDGFQRKLILVAFLVFLDEIDKGPICN